MTGRRARRLQLRHFLDLDDADAAGAVDAEAGVIAVVGKLDAVLDGRLKDGFTLFDVEFPPVDRNLDRVHAQFNSRGNGVGRNFRRADPFEPGFCGQIGDPVNRYRTNTTGAASSPLASTLRTTPEMGIRLGGYLLGKRNRDVSGRIAILKSDGDRHVERLANLLESDGHCVGLGRVGELQTRQREAVDPPIEEPIEVAIGLELERRFHVLGPGLLESPGRVEPPQTSEKHIVADKAAQHVKRQRALVVNERAKHAAVVPNMTQPVAEIDRPLIRSIERPSRHVADDRVEHRLPLDVLGVQRREVLREPFADPLLVIVLPPYTPGPTIDARLRGRERTQETPRNTQDRYATQSGVAGGG